MGWASDQFWKDLGLSPNVPMSSRPVKPKKYALRYKGQTVYLEAADLDTLYTLKDLVESNQLDVPSSRKQLCLQELNKEISKRLTENFNRQGERNMSNLRDVPEVNDCADLVRVCDNRHILGQTDKAIKVRVGQTLYGDPITTFYPKSMCQIRNKPGGGYDVFVPRWVNRDRRCAVGEFECGINPGFSPLPF